MTSSLLPTSCRHHRYVRKHLPACCYPNVVILLASHATTLGGGTKHIKLRRPLSPIIFAISQKRLSVGFVPLFFGGISIPVRHSDKTSTTKNERCARSAVLSSSVGASFASSSIIEEGARQGEVSTLHYSTPSISIPILRVKTFDFCYTTSLSS